MWVGVARKLQLFQNEIAAIESKRFHCHKATSAVQKLMCTEHWRREEEEGTETHANTHTHIYGNFSTSQVDRDRPKITSIWYITIKAEWISIFIITYTQKIVKSCHRSCTL